MLVINGKKIIISNRQMSSQTRIDKLEDKLEVGAEEFVAK